MAPYNSGSLAIIDPLVDILFFGNLPAIYWKKEGKVTETKYIANQKFMAYAVKFQGEEELYWFKESELIIIRS
jgi:hypothetical protein